MTEVLEGDCVEVMAKLEPESVDAVVTDPPYDLTSTGARKGSPRNPGTGPYSRGFMGNAWDGTGVAFRSETWEAAYRVAKPSSYLLAFGGTRTVHRMTVAIEDAGWVIRDLLVWAYASGFPKSKASLKPAWEPIVLARKPGSLRMLAIEECRIGSAPRTTHADGNRRTSHATGVIDYRPPLGDYPAAAGRWPANVILTDPIFDGDTPGVVGGGEAGSVVKFAQAGNIDGKPRAGGGDGPSVGLTGEKWALSNYGDSGTYSRFFLIPKADRADREPVLGGLPVGDAAAMQGNRRTGGRLAGDGRANPEIKAVLRQNVHPTVKPTELMRHLVRLVTPPGGLVLDPFGGSGTTALACEMEGFRWLLIEKEPEYVKIARARLLGTQRGMGLSA